MARQFTTAEFDSEIVNGTTPAVVDFTATWCGPCQALAPHLDEIDKELEGKVQVVKVDVDSNPDLASRFGVMSVPQILFFKDGEVVDKVVGNMPDDIRTKAKALLG